MLMRDGERLSITSPVPAIWIELVAPRDHDVPGKVLLPMDIIYSMSEPPSGEDGIHIVFRDQPDFTVHYETPYEDIAKLLVRPFVRPATKEERETDE